MTTETAVATTDGAHTLEQVVIVGDLARLTPADRVMYYQETCRSLGLNPLTKPFSYIVLNGKLTLYATRTATDQLRAIKGISIDRIDQAEVADIFLATVYGHDREGRTDSEVGAVPIAKLTGENRANAIMKAITKGKRRLTLSLAGLGWLDETEIGSISSAQAADVDMETGEVTPPLPTITETIAAKRAAITSGPIADAPEEPESIHPPEPVIPAGAPDVTPTESGSTNEGRPADEAAPMPAPECNDPSPYDDGLVCYLKAGHRNAHRSTEATWLR